MLFVAVGTAWKRAATGRRRLLAWRSLIACGLLFDSSRAEPSASAERPGPPTVARLPAEFEPQSAVWLIWPQVDHLSGYSNEKVAQQIIEAVAPHTPVKVVATEPRFARRARAALPASELNSGRIEICEIPAVQFWVRDMGPPFVETSAGKLAVADFRFDGWGYADPDGAETRIEEQFDRAAAEGLGLSVVSSRMISEGGDRESNGRGTLLAAEAVELGRNPGMDKAALEAEFRRLLGVKKVIWLKQGLREDDHTFLGPLAAGDGQLAYTAVTTNGHVDEFARFVSPTKILLAQVLPEDIDDPLARENHARMEANYEILRGAVDQDGRPFEIVRVPLPKPVFARMRPGDSVYDFIARLEYRDGSKFPAGEPATVVAAASYLNFLVTNGVVVAPKYGGDGKDPAASARDETVRRLLTEAFPDRRVVMIDALPVNFGGGGIHCITMHQPLLGGAPAAVPAP